MRDIYSVAKPKGYHLVGKNESGGKGEAAAAEGVEFFQTGAKQLHDQDVEFALHSEVLEARDPRYDRFRTLTILPPAISLYISASTERRLWLDLLFSYGGRGARVRA